MFSLVIQALVLYAVSWIFRWFIRHVLSKSDLDNIPGPPAQSYLTGNILQLGGPDAWNIHKEIAQRFGRIIKIPGPLGSQYLYVFDPKALYHIIVKDQDIFEETVPFIVSNQLMFGRSILSTTGVEHRRQRKMLHPVFAAAHIRTMLPLFCDVADKVKRAFELKVARGDQEVDILHWTNRAALEMIGQAGFGWSFDSLKEHEPHPLSTAIQNFVPLWTKMAFQRAYLLPTLVRIGTPRFREFVVRHFPWRPLREFLDVVDTLNRAVTEIFEDKKKALSEGDEVIARQIEQGKDIISILRPVKANMQASAGRLSDTDVSAQMASLVFVGTETTSGALARTFHLLAMHPKIQNKLRREITEIKAMYGNVPDDALLDQLPYLDAVCRETLRLYPPASMLIRTARQDVVLPFSSPVPGVDGREMESMIVPKGTTVVISILNINRDPTIWGDDSDEWKPERWLSPLPQAVHDSHIPGVYGHLLTFLGGARSCIGFKFALLEMKVLLFTLISQFHFSPSKDIHWQMSGVVFPTVKGIPGKAQLPVTLEVVDAEF